MDERTNNRTNKQTEERTNAADKQPNNIMASPTLSGGESIIDQATALTISWNGNQKKCLEGNANYQHQQNVYKHEHPSQSYLHNRDYSF